MPDQPPTLLQAAREVISVAGRHKLPPSLRGAIDALATAANAHSDRQRANAEHRTVSGRRQSIDRSEVVRLRTEGLTLAQIANEVGCSPNHISKILRAET